MCEEDRGRERERGREGERERETDRERERDFTTTTTKWELFVKKVVVIVVKII